VLLVDATAEETFDEARTLLDDFLAPASVPYVVAANKQDREGALRPDKLRRALGLGAEALILPCTASQRTSVQFVLKQLAQTIPT
jgi:signal recognition particle receptor subunit beta